MTKSWASLKRSRWLGVVGRWLGSRSEWKGLRSGDEATASSLASVLTHLHSCSLLCDRPPELPFSAHSASSSPGGRPNAPPTNVSNASAAALQREKGRPFRGRHPVS